MPRTSEQKRRDFDQNILNLMRAGNTCPISPSAQVAIDQAAEHWKARGVRGVVAERQAKYVDDAATKLNISPDHILSLALSLLERQWGYDKNEQLEDPPPGILREVQAVGRWAKEYGIPFD